jgi:ATP-binding cassette subfamily B protein
LVYWFGGMMAISGTISNGTIVAFVAYLGMIYSPLTALVNARIAFIKVCLFRMFLNDFNLENLSKFLNDL